MGHMNVRFYVAKQMEGLAILAPSIGLPYAFRPRAASTLQPFDQHIRFMREVHPGRPITMEGGVLEITDDAALIYQELKHTVSGETAAAFRTWVRHVDTRRGRPFSWNEQTLQALERLKITPPEHTAPRSVDPSKPALPDKDATIERLNELGIPVIGRTAVSSNECDTHGRMFTEHFMGRVSDAVPNLMSGWRDQVAAAAAAKGNEIKTGAAVLEYRLRYRQWPRTGDVIEVRSGLGQVQEKVHSLVHWLTNPVSGQVLCTSEAIAVTFDINTRKIVPTNPDHMQLLEERVPRGLSI